MPEMLNDPTTWMLAVVVAGLAYVLGRLRREPTWSIVVTAIGVNAFFIGFRWAGSIGEEAFWAASLTAGGFAVWQETAQRVQRAASKSQSGGAEA